MSRQVFPSLSYLHPAINLPYIISNIILGLNTGKLEDMRMMFAKNKEVNQTTRRKDTRGRGTAKRRRNRRSPYCVKQREGKD